MKNSRKAITASLLSAAFMAGLKRREHFEPLHVQHNTPMKLSRNDWKVALFGTKDALGDKNLPSFAAGIAYYSVLAFFPFLAALVAVSALVISSEQLAALIGAAELYLPADVSSLVASQLERLVSRRSDNVLAAIIAIAVAIFGASVAAKGLVVASNVVYGVKESRGWLAQQIWGVVWTVFGIAFIAITLAFLTLKGDLLEHFNLPPALITALLFGRWLVLLASCILGLSIFYKYGPNRPNVRWHCVIWGAVLATTAWLLATIGFFVYVQNFANYTQSYSLFAGIIMLMVWMNLSALIVLLGAEINHQLEKVGHKKQGGLFNRTGR